MTEEKYISFKHDEKWADVAFSRFIKRKVFKTKEFSEEFSINKVKKLYVPFYQFRTKNNIHAFFEFVSHSTNNGTSRYYYEIIMEAELENITCCAQELNDKYISNILPYKLSKLVSMSNADNDCEKIIEIKNVSEVKVTNIRDIEENMKKIAVKNCPVIVYDFMHDTSQYNTEYRNVDVIYLPVWIIEVKALDKTYEFYINDQTGKIAGDVPVNQFNDFSLFANMCIIIAVLLVVLTAFSITFKTDTIFYAIEMTIVMLILFWGYIGITTRYSMKYKCSKAKVIKKKCIKRKRYLITEFYQKALNKFKAEMNEI